MLGRMARASTVADLIELRVPPARSPCQPPPAGSKLCGRSVKRTCSLAHDGSTTCWACLRIGGPDDAEKLHVLSETLKRVQRDLEGAGPPPPTRFSDPAQFESRPVPPLFSPELQLASFIVQEWQGILKPKLPERAIASGWTRPGPRAASRKLRLRDRRRTGQAGGDLHHLIGD